MKRIAILFGISLTALIAALLIPRPNRVAPVNPPQPVVAGNGSLTITARPSRHSFLASGDDIAVVYDITAKAGGEQRRPVDFALILDRSGSMTGEPLAKAKAAAQSLVKRLTPGDRLAVVQFGSDARTSLALTTMDDAGKTAAATAIDAVAADGGTNMSAALEAAETALKEAPSHELAIRRVVLLTDGEANEGEVGQALVQLVRQESDRGLRISALGLGIDFDEEMMMTIAETGGGQYRYLRDGDEVASALTAELAAASTTAATAISLSLTPTQGVTILESPGMTHDATGDGWRFRLNDLAAGETRHVTVVVHAGPGAVGARALLDAQLSYTDVPAGRLARTTDVLASATATTDASAVARSYDAEAAKVAMRARWGGTMLEAGRLYRQNRIDEARAVLKDKASAFKEESAKLGDDGVAMGRAFEADSASAADFLTGSPSSAPARKALKVFATGGLAATR